MAIEKLTIENTDVYLEDFCPGQGKITISDTCGHNYSYYWGSMGSNMREFLSHINASYFGSKMMGSKPDYTIDVRKTFANLRRHIATELDLPWYKHLEFQKGMREVLASFQAACEESGNEYYFVELFRPSFIDRLPYYEVYGINERKNVENSFRSISEWWGFIDKKPNDEYMWLIRFFKKLQRAIGKQVAAA